MLLGNARTSTISPWFRAFFNASYQRSKCRTPDKWSTAYFQAELFRSAMPGQISTRFIVERRGVHGVTYATQNGPVEEERRRDVGISG